jgi:hypothetical protein
VEWAEYQKQTMDLHSQNNTPLNPLSPNSSGQARGETNSPLLGRGVGVGRQMFQNPTQNRLNLTVSRLK